MNKCLILLLNMLLISTLEGLLFPNLQAQHHIWLTDSAFIFLGDTTSKGLPNRQSQYLDKYNTLRMVAHYKDGVLHGKFVEFDRKGTKIKEMFYLAGEPEGKAMIYSSSGNLIEHLYYEDGLLHRTQKEYYENTVLKSEKNYYKGIPQGNWKYYYDNGSLRQTEVWKDGRLYEISQVQTKDGRKLNPGNFSKGSGTRLLYDENGLLKAKVSYLNSKLFGDYLEYEVGSQQVKAKRTFKNDTLNGEFWECKAGKLLHKGYHKDNFLDSTYQEFYPDSTLAVKGWYIAGFRYKTWIFYYPNGKVREQGQYSAGKKSGLWEEWYPDEKPKLKENWAEGKKNGTATYYYPNGRIKAVYKYERDSLNGVASEFYPNGLQASIGNYAGNQAEGLWKYYQYEGKKHFLAEEGYYVKNQRKGEWKEYAPNKMLIATGFYEDGLKHGTWKFYYPNQKPKMIEHWHLGKLLYISDYLDKKGKKLDAGTVQKGEGIRFLYHDNGNLYASGKIEQGLPNGDWKYYYRNGRISMITTFVNGKKQGLSRTYYPNGKPKADLYYDEDKPTGEFSNYTKKGKIKLK